jgi:hypothetical protein
MLSHLAKLISAHRCGPGRRRGKIDNAATRRFNRIVAIRWVLFWLYLFILIGAEATSSNSADPDLWHRLAVGEMLWQTGHFPAGGTFSYLADFARIADHEWGSAVIFYAAYAWGGGSAIVGLKLVTLTITLALLVWAGMQGRRPTLLLAAFYAVVLLALLPSFQSTVRCMAFTNVFFALWLYWFQLERHGRAVPVWAYVVTAMVWANLHGGVTVGLAWLLGVTLVELGQGREWRKWALRFSLSGLATLVNPFGIELWVSTGRALLTTRSGFDEWAPVSWWPEPLAYPGYKLLLCGAVVALALMIRRRGWKGADRPAIILIGGALALSLVSARHTSLFAAVAGALLPEFFSAEPRLAGDGYRLGTFGVRAALVLIPFYATLRLLPGEGLRLGYPANSCPLRAVDFLEQGNTRGNLLVPFNYGSYALWRLRGRMRVSMDGRYDLVYLPATYRRVDDFFFARGDWPALLREPAPAAILLPTADPVYPKLKTEPGWNEAYRDGTDAVFLPR